MIMVWLQYTVLILPQKSDLPGAVGDGPEKIVIILMSTWLQGLLGAILINMSCDMQKGCLNLVFTNGLVHPDFMQTV